MPKGNEKMAHEIQLDVLFEMTPRFLPPFVRALGGISHKQEQMPHLYFSKHRTCVVLHWRVRLVLSPTSSSRWYTIACLTPHVFNVVNNALHWRVRLVWFRSGRLLLSLPIQRLVSQVMSFCYRDVFLFIPILECPFYIPSSDAESGYRSDPLPMR